MYQSDVRIPSIDLIDAQGDRRYMVPVVFVCASFNALKA